MSKSDKKNSKSQPNPPGEEPKIIEIDEGVFGRLSQRLEKQKGRFAELRKARVMVAVEEFGDGDDPREEIIDEGEGEREEEFEKRLQAILGKKQLEVSERTLKTYLEFLKKHVRVPCPVKACQEFEWEEYYLYGPGSLKEYEKLKRIRPSHTDKFQIIRFEDKIESDDDGILVEVQRLTDSKNFTLNLYELEATDEESASAEFLDDYAVWFVNYI
ncbi:calcium-binding protein [Kamptonema formosum]|uniref:calcium-binding protein n=1 Tax=Kamptonema formosum TaxID=331992 RepID=UPI0005C47028|nr:calcium-binding protein [Oscillatoria sp. PCC 10802]